jgi:maleate isomerase
MANRIRLGFLTPSSNTTLEPVTAAMLAGLPEVSAHFARFPVTEIALSAGALGQFDPGPILAAARLLAHAKVDVIAWNGTSASWLGFETDAALCAQITAETGIPATTSILAMNELIARLGVRALGLVTPYLAEVQARIIANYRGLGLACDAERHCGLQDNFAFAEVTAAQLQAMTREVAAARPDAIAVVCTNLRAAPLAAALEAETGITMLDSIATVVWKSLALAGVDPARVTGWGRLFAVRP